MSADTALRTAEPKPHGAAGYVKMVRMRRGLIVALVVLIVLLLVAFMLLLRIFRPVGRIATPEETGGLEWVRSIYGWGNRTEQQLASPQCVAIAPDGLIWVTDAGLARVIGFNPDGSFNTLLHQGPRGSSKNALSFPASVAVDEDGIVYIGDQTASQVVVMTPDNKIVRRIPVPRPQSVAARGDLLVVGSTPGFVIMTKTGDVRVLIGSGGKGDYEFNVVSGIAIDADGTIYIADLYNNRVSAYKPDGTRKWIRVTGNPGNQATVQDSMQSKPATAEAGMQLPSGLTIDGAGRLVVVDAFGFNLVVLDRKDGHLIAKHGEAGVQDGKFVYPSAVSYDPSRDYFAIADTAMDRVQIVRIPGSGATPLAAVNRTLLGPLRACLIPLALLVVAIAAGFVYTRLRRRNQEDDTAPDEAQPETAEA